MSSPDGRSNESASPQFHYCYSLNQDVDPDNWSKSYPPVRGPFQSPVNIETENAKSLEMQPLRWLNYETSPKRMKITNNGHTVVLSGKWHKVRPYIGNGPLATNYVFSQLHFHWGQNDGEGSEHAVNGESSPLEMHVVHFNSSYENQEEAVKEKDGLVVISFLFKLRSKPAPGIQHLIDSLQHIRDPNTSVDVVAPFPLSCLFDPFEEQYFLYWGSLAPPPCTQLILWLICQKPLSISASQLAEFRTLTSSHGGLLVRNFRPVQPLNGRTIFSVIVKEDATTKSAESKVVNKTLTDVPVYYQNNPTKVPGLNVKSKKAEIPTKGFRSDLKKTGKEEDVWKLRKITIMLRPMPGRGAKESKHDPTAKAEGVTKPKRIFLNPYESSQIEFVIPKVADMPSQLSIRHSNMAVKASVSDMNDMAFLQDLIEQDTSPKDKELTQVYRPDFSPTSEVSLGNKDSETPSPECKVSSKRNMHVADQHEKVQVRDVTHAGSGINSVTSLTKKYPRELSQEILKQCSIKAPVYVTHVKAPHSIFPNINKGHMQKEDFFQSEAEQFYLNTHINEARAQIKEEISETKSPEAQKLIHQDVNISHSESGIGDPSLESPVEKYESSYPKLSSTSGTKASSQSTSPEWNKGDSHPHHEATTYKDSPSNQQADDSVLSKVRSSKMTNSRPGSQKIEKRSYNQITRQQYNDGSPNKQEQQQREVLSHKSTRMPENVSAETAKKAESFDVTDEQVESIDLSEREVDAGIFQMDMLINGRKLNEGFQSSAIETQLYDKFRKPYDENNEDPAYNVDLVINNTKSSNKYQRKTHRSGEHSQLSSDSHLATATRMSENNSGSQSQERREEEPKIVSTTDSFNSHVSYEPENEYQHVKRKHRKPKEEPVCETEIRTKFRDKHGIDLTIKSTKTVSAIDKHIDSTGENEVQLDPEPSKQPVLEYQDKVNPGVQATDIPNRHSGKSRKSIESTREVKVKAVRTPKSAHYKHEYTTPPESQETSARDKQKFGDEIESVETSQVNNAKKPPLGLRPEYIANVASKHTKGVPNPDFINISKGREAIMNSKQQPLQNRDLPKKDYRVPETSKPVRIPSDISADDSFVVIKPESSDTSDREVKPVQYKKKKSSRNEPSLIACINATQLQLSDEDRGHHRKKKPSSELYIHGI